MSCEAGCHSRSADAAHHLRRASLTLLALAIAAAAAASAACGGSASPAGYGLDATQASRPAQARVGDTVTLQIPNADAALAVTVIEVRTTVHADDDAARPRRSLFGVEVRLRDVGDEPITEEPDFSAHVVDTAETSYETAEATHLDVAPALDQHVSLAPGGEVIGWLAFEVPRGTRVAQIVWVAEGGVGDTGTWNR